MNNRRYIIIRKFIVAFCLVTLFSVVLETKAFAGSFGCIFGMSNGCIAPTPTPNNTVSPQTTMQTMLQTMTKIAAVEQDLMLAEEFYQYMKSLKYMTAAPGLMGAVGYVSNLTSGISSIGQMGVMAGHTALSGYTHPQKKVSRFKQ
jgi:ribonucleotide reductase alpha subunit